jgi:non-ribosomal peptide synthetase component F
MNITHGLRRALQVKSCDTAMIFEGRRRTWQEIGDRVSRFAGGLRAHGLGRSDRIAVLMEDIPASGANQTPRGYVGKGQTMCGIAGWVRGLQPLFRSRPGAPGNIGRTRPAATTCATSSDFQ